MPPGHVWGLCMDCDEAERWSMVIYTNVHQTIVCKPSIYRFNFFTDKIFMLSTSIKDEVDDTLNDKNK